MGSSSTITTGYKYVENVLFSLGLPFVTKILEVRFDDKIAWKGEIDQAGTMLVKEPTLFGGKDSQGGVQGLIDFMPGGDTQPINPVLEYFIEDEYGEDLTSAYRNFSCLFFRGVLTPIVSSAGSIPWVPPLYESETRVSGFDQDFADGELTLGDIKKRSAEGVSSQSFYWTANSPTPKKLEILTVSTHDHMTWQPSLRVIDDEMNPAHICYSVLTDPRMGQPYPVFLINQDSWSASAQTLFDEGFGMSLEWQGETSKKEFLEEIQDTINGNIVENRRTGELHLNLVRPIADASQLPIFDASNSRLVRKSTRTFSKLVNEITVRYHDIELRKVTPVTVQNLASIDTLGRASSATFDYLGVTKPELAWRIAQRELQFNSQGLSTYELINTDGSAFDIYTGDAIVLNFPHRGVENAVVRVVDVRIPADGQSDIVFEAIEDAFLFPESGYGANPPVLSGNSGAAPQVTPNYRFDDLNYYEMVTGYPDAVQATWDDQTVFVNLKASRPTRNSIDTILYDVDDAEIVARDDFTVRLLLGQELEVLDFDPVDHTAEINFFTPSDSGIDAIDSIGLGYIGDEQVFFESLNVVTGVATVVRAVNDTLPMRHVNGTEIWIHNGGASSTVDGLERTFGETLNYKIGTRSSTGETPLSTLSDAFFTTQGRYGRPYPPGDVRIDGELFPKYFTEDLNLTWAHRDKTLQLADPISWFESSIGPEAGVDYNVELLSDTDLSIVDQFETSDSFTFDQVSDRTIKNQAHTARSGIYTTNGVEPAIPMSNTQLTVNIKSRYIASGFESYQTYTHTVLRRGYGYAYGVY